MDKIGVAQRNWIRKEVLWREKMLRSEHLLYLYTTRTDWQECALRAWTDSVDDLDSQFVAQKKAYYRRILNLKDRDGAPQSLHLLLVLDTWRCKRLANPPLRVGANQANAVFFQFHGKSSWSFLLGQVGSFSSTSQRYAKGSMPLSLHVSMML